MNHVKSLIQLPLVVGRLATPRLNCGLSQTILLLVWVQLPFTLGMRSVEQCCKYCTTKRQVDHYRFLLLTFLHTYYTNVALLALKHDGYRQEQKLLPCIDWFCDWHTRKCFSFGSQTLAASLSSILCGTAIKASSMMEPSMNAPGGLCSTEVPAMWDSSQHH